MISINWDDLNEEQRSFVEELVSTCVYDIVHAEEDGTIPEKGIMHTRKRITVRAYGACFKKLWLILNSQVSLLYF